MPEYEFFQRKPVFCHILRRVRSLTDPVYRFYETELILNINIDLILQCKPHSLQNQASIEEGQPDLHQRILIVMIYSSLLQNSSQTEPRTGTFWHFFSDISFPFVRRIISSTNLNIIIQTVSKTIFKGDIYSKSRLS